MDSPREAFYFTKDQLRIVLFLVFLIAAIGGGTLVYPYFKPATENTDSAFLDSAKKLAIALKEKEQSDTSDSAPKYTNSNYIAEKTTENKAYQKPVLFPFDPNKIGVAEWQKLGYSPKQAETIERIKKQGITFRTAEDLKKIKIIGDEGYDRLKAYVQIEQQPTHENKAQAVSATKLIDLNTADSATFEQLPMVAKYLSSRLVSYRKELGGYYAIEQIKEIKGLREATYELIKDKLTVTPGQLKKIAVNAANDNALIAHPYLPAPALKRLLTYKKANGKIADKNALKEAIADDAVYNKILPYIAF